MKIPPVILCLLSFSGAACATLIRLDLYATTSATSLTPGIYLPPTGLEKLIVGDPLVFSLSISSNYYPTNSNFSESFDPKKGYAPIYYTNIYNQNGLLLDQDYSVYSTFGLSDSILSGVMLSGPNRFDYSFSHNLSTNTGTVTLLGWDHVYSGSLTATINRVSYTVLDASPATKPVPEGGGTVILLGLGLGAVGLLKRSKRGLGRKRSEILL